MHTMAQTPSNTAAQKRPAIKTTQASAAPKAVKTARKSPAKPATKSPAQTTASVAKPIKPQAPTVTPKANTAPAKPAKEKKVKVVRDSFTLPKTELLQIAVMKKRAMALGVEVKKSELIRAGLQALSTLTDAPFKKALGNVPTIKTGRPAKG
jgi:hypothetical protein